MIENPMKRVAAILLTALMLFSTVVVAFPQGTASAASESNDIIIPVIYGSDIATSATVILTEVHDGTQYTATFSSPIQKYVVSNARAGHYTVQVSASNNYTYRDYDGISHDGLTKTEIDTVILEPFPSMDKNYTSITVKDWNTGNPISGATVSFYNPQPGYEQTLTSRTTGSDGKTYIRIFSSTVLDLVASKAGYEATVTPIADTSSPAAMTIYLNESATVIGQVKLKNGDSVENIVAHMYNNDPVCDPEKRVLDSANAGSWLLKFYAYPANWTLVVDGSNADPYVDTISWASLTTGSQTNLGSIQLDLQNMSVESDEMTFSDWNNLMIWSNSTWKADRTYPGLPYSDIGSLRAQLDLGVDSSDMDGSVDLLEYSDFVSILTSHGSKYLTTSNLIHMNNTLYTSQSFLMADLTDFSGDLVSDSSDIVYNAETSCLSKTTLATNGSYYLARFNATFDTSKTNYTYTLRLVVNGAFNSYELSYNQTGTTKATVRGYTELFIEPTYSSTPGVAAITMTVQKSVAPVARGEIEDKPTSYVRMKNTTVVGYIVQKNKNVTFDSSKTTDANGNPLTYTWEFGDGNSTTTRSTKVYHNYTVNKNVTVNLTVTDIVGKFNKAVINVSIDGKVPRPVMKVMNSTGGAMIAPYTIDQGTQLKFSPSGSIDDLITLDGWGTIYSYTWKFGKDAEHQNLASATNQNETYRFDTAGLINVTLNVTDVVGNYKNMTVQINVKDKTAPVLGTLKMLNATWGVTLLERSPIYFDATETTDNVDNISALKFNWSFGEKVDGKLVTKEGIGLANANVTHTYASYGQYVLYLNITDASGNNVSKQQTIYVGMGKRPDVNVDKISFEPKSFEEGVTGRILVNITNTGSAAANNTKLEVWWYSGAVAQKRIGNITTIYDKNGTSITSLKVGQSGYAYFDWIPDAKGNYSIRVNVTSDDQAQSNWDVENVEVKQAGWKDIVLPISILVVIIVVPILLLARRRMGSTGTMMRRSKKDKEAVKEKKEEKA